MVACFPQKNRIKIEGTCVVHDGGGETRERQRRRPTRGKRNNATAARAPHEHTRQQDDQYYNFWRLNDEKPWDGKRLFREYF